MTSDLSKRVADRAKKLYDEKYRQSLEETNRGAFVCIEPESEDYFLGSTLDDAVNQAIDAHPDRLMHTLRIGHEAAIHLGVLSR